MSAIATQPNPQSSVEEKRAYATKLRALTAACRVRHEKLGVRKALTREQTAQAAASFNADGGSIQARKLLIDTKDQAYRDVINVKSRATAHWKHVTTPFPEPGIRLIRRDMIENFNQTMEGLKAELHEAAQALQETYAALRERAREQLGDLFSESDYPARVDDQFELEWDFPAIEPPSYLKNLHPALYEQESERIRARFEEAVRLTEQAFVAKFHGVIAHLADRLAGGVDGKPKIIKDSAIENLNAFFAEFKQFDIGSSAELGELIDQAQAAVAGVNTGELRENEAQRAQLAGNLNKIQEAVDALMINKPKRAISLDDQE